MNNFKTHALLILIGAATLMCFLIDILLIGMINQKDDIKAVDSTDICMRLHMKDQTDMPDLEMENKEA